MLGNQVFILSPIWMVSKMLWHSRLEVTPLMYGSCLCHLTRELLALWEQLSCLAHLRIGLLCGRRNPLWPSCALMSESVLVDVVALWYFLLKFYCTFLNLEEVSKASEVRAERCLKITVITKKCLFMSCFHMMRLCVECWLRKFIVPLPYGTHFAYHRRITVLKPCSLHHLYFFYDLQCLHAALPPKNPVLFQ